MPAQGVDVRANLQAVRERIAAASRRAKRDPAGVLLVAVTKGVDLERVGQAIAVGAPALGENRVQEAAAKIKAIGHAVPWHFVGKLQTNKVKDALGLFAMIQSLDRIELAGELDRRARALGKVGDVLVQVNVAREPTKAGFMPEALGSALQAIAPLGWIRVRGLMAMVPLAADAQASRQWFGKLRELRQEATSWRIPGIELEHLSMGTSQDFEVAVEEGATMVRVGQAIFGSQTTLTHD